MINSYGDKNPSIDDSCFKVPDTVIVGDVIIGENLSFRIGGPVPKCSETGGGVNFAVSLTDAGPEIIPSEVPITVNPTEIKRELSLAGRRSIIRSKINHSDYIKGYEL